MVAGDSSDSSDFVPSPRRTRQAAAGNGSQANNAPVDMDTDTSTDEEVPTRRKTRGRTNARVEETDSDDSGPKTRSGRRPAAKAPPSPAKSKPAPNAEKKKQAPKKAPASVDEDDSDTPGDYVHVQVGDTVLLDSGDPDDNFIALVSSVQTSQRTDKPILSFTAQWYYKPEDVDEDVLALIPGGALENEVFLSPHKDKNSIDAVIEICQVVSPEEYKDIQDEIRRGYREKGKTYFVCRYKYYPNRSNRKKALEVIENDAIRSGLGRPKPNIGDSYQALVPAFVKPPVEPVKLVDSCRSIVPWQERPNPNDRPCQVWSPHVLNTHNLEFRQFIQLVDTLRYSTGNIVKTYRQDSKRKGHVRAIILKSFPGGEVRLCLSTGEDIIVLKSDLCSLLPEDVAMRHFYLSRFNFCQAALDCSRTLLGAQQGERDAFRREVVLFAQLAAEEQKEAEANSHKGDKDDSDSSRKRRK